MHPTSTSDIRTLFTMGAVALAAALGTPTLTGAQSEQYVLTGEKVAVYSLAGQVQVNGGSGSAVRVEVFRGGADASRLQVRTGSIRGRETLRVIYPDDRVVYPELGRRQSTHLRVREDGTFGDGGSGGRRVTITGSGGGLQAYADLTVQVPPGQELAVYLGAGKAFVSNVDGRIRVDTGSAPVTAEKTRGALIIDVGSSPVKVTDAEGEVVVDTGSGSVALSRIRGKSLSVDTGSGAVKGGDISVETLTVDTGSGRIELSETQASEILLDTGSGHVELELMSDVTSLVIDTGSGGVTVVAPPTLSAEVEIETGSGGIEVDFPLDTTKLSRSSLLGRIGDGKGRITIDTGSGSVRLVRR